MSEIESLISRYLDGELNPTQLARLHHLLSESTEARQTLREMVAISRAARQTPGLHIPSASVEGRLFSRLASEGLYRQQPVQGAARSIRSAAAANRASRTYRLAAAAVVLFLAIIGSSYWTGLSTGNIRAVRPGAIAMATRPTLFPAHIDAGVNVEPPAIVVASARRIVTRSTPSVGRSVNRPAPSMPFADARAAIDTQSRLTTTPPEILPLASLPPTPQMMSSSEREQLPLPRSLADEIASSQNDRPSTFAASVRMGQSLIDRELNIASDEISLRLDAQLGRGHQVSLIVGHSPAIKEMRAENTQAVVAGILSAPDPNDPFPWQHPIPSYSVQVQNEVWVGLGYNYAVPISGSVQAEPGAKVGAGATSWRVGVELPVRLRVTRSFSVEIVPSVSHVIPRDRSSSEYAIDDAPDRYIYDARAGRPTFTSYGVELGLRVDIR